MGKRQLAALFLCSLVPWSIGNGLTPLLPIYAIRLGASPAEAGCQLAFTHAALAVGVLAANWLSERLRSRKALIIAAGALAAPTMWLLRRVQNAWELAAVAAVWAFWAGTCVAQVHVLGGLFAAEGERGKVFGLLSLSPVLGALFGGLAMGRIAQRWGYPFLFTSLALFGLLWPLAAGLLEDRMAASGLEPRSKGGAQAVGLGRGFYCLFLGSLAVTLAAYVFISGRSLVMVGLGFDATAVSTTSALSEVPVLPLPLLLGWLSDRFGRKRFLIVGYLVASAGLLGLTVSTSLWQFWLCSALVTVSLVTGAVGTALVTDLVPGAALGKGLSLWNATTPLAGILGYAGAGYAMQHFGSALTFVPGALLPLLGIALTLSVRRPGEARVPARAILAGGVPAIPLPAAA